MALAIGVNADALRGRVDRGSIPHQTVAGRRAVNLIDVFRAYPDAAPETDAEVEDIVSFLYSRQEARKDPRGPVASSQPLSSKILPPPGDEDDEGVVDSGAEYATEISASPEALLLKRGLDPEDWNITDVSATDWQGPVAGGGIRVLERLAVSVKRRRPLDLILPARSDGWVAPAAQGRRATWEKPLLAVVVSDQQAPYHDPVLHELFCAWLDENRPDRGVINGDLIDLPDVSRHRNNPNRPATVRECIQTGYDLARGYVENSPGCEWDFIPGNHDERIRNFLIDFAPEIYDVPRATPPGQDQEEPVWDLSFLMRFDELGIEYVDPDGKYDQAQVKLSPHLAVRHGWLAVKGAAESARKTLEHLGYSIIVGHTHRQGISHITKHDIDRNPETHQAVEGGCMCIISDRPVLERKGANYTPAPDWQNGFTTATIWPDGTFKTDLATYFDGTLIWRDQRYA